MKNARTTRSLLRGTMIAAAALAAATAVTAVATPEAHASAATAVASFLGGKVASGVANLGVAFLWDAIFSDASSSGLTSTDLAAIQDIVAAELTEHELASEIDTADAVLQLAREYRRGTTLADLGTAQAKLLGDDGYDGILDKTSTLLQHLDDHGMQGSSTYIIMASLRVAFLKELREIHYAVNVLSPGTYSASTLGSELVHVRDQASSALTQLQSFEATFDAQFGAVSRDVNSGDKWHEGSGSIYCNGDGASVTTAKYCFSGPDGKTCSSGSFGVFKCSYASDGPTTWTDSSGTDALETMAQANILLQQAKMSYRDSQLAPQYYELKRSLTRIADGDFEYCGNGTCAIGEIDSCADDCAGQFDEVGNFSHTTSAPKTKLSTSEARLDWQSDGNFVLYDTTTSPESIRWQADLVGTTGYKLVFQSSDGNLVLRNSSNVQIWASNTSGLASRLVLLGKTLYIVDGDGTYYTDANGVATLNGTGRPAWSSDEDSYRYKEVEDRFCYDTSATVTLLSSNTGFVKWVASGYLATYQVHATGYQRTWYTDTSGTGAYLCNQEDGNLVIYNSWGQELWSSGTGRGVGGHLVSVGDQLRTTTDSGDLMWASPTCSMASCTQDNRVASRSAATITTLTKSQAQTILENEKARLDWQSNGKLALYNKTTGAKIYESVAGAKLLVGGPNGLMVQSSSNVVQWQLSINPWVESVVLADCNLFGARSTGEGEGAINTSCDDTAG